MGTAPMQILSVLLICYFSIVRTCRSPENDYITSLGSENLNWKFENKNGSVKGIATVPGGIYSDLMNSKIIGDIFFKYNDVETRWISKDQWKYYTEFNVPANILDKRIINLVFDGLDTVSNIKLNGIKIGTSNNMFVKYKFDVKKYLKDGLNNITVEFESPVEAAAERSKLYETLPECVPSFYNGECHANQLRKMQASFSWDWGPAFPSVGIWKPVYIEAYNGSIIGDVTTELKYVDEDSIWNVTINITLETAPQEERLEGHLFATILLNRGLKLTVDQFIEEKQIKSSTLKKQLVLKVPSGHINVWWPNGYGEQHLYPLEITFQNTRTPDEYFKKNMNIGFRTIELIQKPLNMDGIDGLSFYFNVNNVPLFMKGSNWIPSSILPEYSYDKNTVDCLLHSAKHGNMNMLRVWGGGVYESDNFYEKCDELGILIWQDLMFACSMYPVDAEFIQSVSTEVEQAVLRLQHHPSLAIWAGNNENEAALRGNWYQTAPQFDKYKTEYVKLYVDTIKPIVETNDPTRTYVVSSPSNGIESEEEGFVALNPYDARYGDTHYYNYLADLWSMETYPKTRFSSEYGYQSLPSLETWLTSTNETVDLDIYGKFLNHREHQAANDYMNMKLQMEMQINSPNPNDVDYFNTFVYHSQIVQAMAMKTETEFYRQSRYEWMTMGALYWQLNDVWQAPSWSGIEFGGNWKMLHYFAKEFFSPVLVSPRLYLFNEMAAYVINDRPIPIINGTLTVDTFNWNSFNPNASQKMFFSALPNDIIKLNVNVSLPSSDAEKNKVFYRFSLTDNEGKLISPHNFIFPTHLKNIQGLQIPKIELEINNKQSSKPNKTEYEINVKTNAISLFVWIDVPKSIGYVSENGFIMTEPVKKITLYSNQMVDTNVLKNKLKVRSLNIVN